MAASALHIAYNPPAKAGGEALSNRLGGTFLYLPLSHTAKTIRRNLQTLCEALGTSYDPSEDEARAEAALLHAKKLLGETEIAIDYTATPAPMSLARCLLEHGFLHRRGRSGRLPLAAGTRAGHRALRHRAGKAPRSAARNANAHARHRPEGRVFHGNAALCEHRRGRRDVWLRRALPVGGADGGSAQNRAGRARFYPAKRIGV